MNETDLQNVEFINKHKKDLLALINLIPKDKIEKPGLLAEYLRDQQYKMNNMPFREIEADLLNTNYKKQSN